MTRRLGGNLHREQSNQRSPRGGEEEEDEDDYVMTSGEVAKLFNVDPKTVSRWARTGQLTFMETLGGQRRFSKREVREKKRGSGKRK